MGFAEDILARARGDLNRAERDAAVARERLVRAEAEIGDLQAFLRKLEHYVGPVGEAASRSDSAARRSRIPHVAGGGKSRDLVDVAIDKIREVGARVPITDLFNAILERGMKIGGKDEKSNLAGYLSRDPRVDYERGIGWGIVTEGAASAPASQEAAPSSAEGGSNERATLALEPDLERLLGPSTSAGAS